jgi:hypothetical protein
MLRNIDIEQNKWWITYDKKTSQVKGVSPTLVTSKKFSVVESKNECCQRILSGNHSLRNFGMVWDMANDRWDIGEKSYRLNIRQLSRKLFNIVNNNPLNSDVHLTFNMTKNIMNIRVNYENLKRSMNLMGIHEISKEEGTLFNLYITKKNNPDFLIQSISIDPESLLKNKTIDYELINIKTFNEWKDLSVYTRPIFRRYSVEYITEEVTSDYAEEKNATLQKVTNSDKGTAHIDIYKLSNRLIKLTSNISESSKYVMSGRKGLKFLVGDGTIDNLAGGFSVKTTELLNNKDVKVNLDFDFPDNPIIVYINKYVSVRYNKESNNE